MTTTATHTCRPFEPDPDYAAEGISAAEQEEQYWDALGALVPTRDWGTLVCEKCGGFLK